MDGKNYVLCCDCCGLPNVRMCGICERGYCQYCTYEFLYRNKRRDCVIENENGDKVRPKSLIANCLLYRDKKFLIGKEVIRKCYDCIYISKLKKLPS